MDNIDAKKLSFSLRWSGVSSKSIQRILSKMDTKKLSVLLVKKQLPAVSGLHHVRLREIPLYVLIRQTPILGLYVLKLAAKN